MKKLIVKTTAITLGILIVVTASFYLLLSCFSPSVLGDVYFQTQNARLSIKYSEKAYQKTNDISDLATLVERCIVFDDDDKALYFGVSLINDKDYSSLLKLKSDGYHYYIVGIICEIQYLKGNRQTALQTAFSNTGEYVAYNPVHKLILISAQNDDTDSLIAIKTYLQQKDNDNQLISKHVSLIEQLIN